MHAPKLGTSQERPREAKFGQDFGGGCDERGRDTRGEFGHRFRAARVPREGVGAQDGRVPEHRLENLRGQHPGEPREKTSAKAALPGELPRPAPLEGALRHPRLRSERDERVKAVGEADGR